LPDKPKHINPHLKRHESRRYTIEECLEGIVHDRQILSYLISKSESPLPKDIEFVQQVLARTTARKDTKRIGVSGAPGVGKSTLLNTYCNHLAERGNSVAILPIDPSSQLSKGSILGDKTRMDLLVGNAKVYIKPSASALALGGIAPSTMVALMLCERAGFDYIFIETVGVGQSEIEVRQLVDCFILLLQPGGGDELQGVKRGIMEIADIYIINKADGELKTEANKSLKAYRQAVHLLAAGPYNWIAKAATYSSVSLDGLEKLASLIEQFFDHMKDDDRLQSQRLEQATNYFKQQVHSIDLARFRAKYNLNELYQEIKRQLADGSKDLVTSLVEYRKRSEDEIN